MIEGDHKMADCACGHSIFLVDVCKACGRQEKKKSSHTRKRWLHFRGGTLDVYCLNTEYDYRKRETVVCECKNPKPKVKQCQNAQNAKKR